MNYPKLYPWGIEEVEKTINAQLTPHESENESNTLTRTMAGVVSRMAAKTTERTNRLSEKVLLEYFSLAGKSKKLPNPAVVPVKFYQTTTKETTTVPALTQVSTLTSDQKKPILFETTEDLRVTKPTVEKFIVADFDRNRYEDKSNLIETILERPEKLYNTDTPFSYDLHLYHPLFDELGDSDDYWLQIVLPFKDGEPNKNNNPKIKKISHCQMVDQDTTNNEVTDYNLFSIKLSYLDCNNKTASFDLKISNESIRNINHNGDKLYTVPLQISEQIGERTISGLSPQNESIKRSGRFVSVSFEILNREYFNYFNTPELIGASFRLFYKPERKDGFLTYEQGQENRFAPTYRDVTNVERAFYNDKKLDLSKPFKPFGTNPQLGDTFAFSSKFFGMPGERCEINLWMMGDLDYSSQIPNASQPFKNENNPDHKVYNPDCMLGWEYFDGKEWKIFGTSSISSPYTMLDTDSYDSYGTIVENTFKTEALPKSVAFFRDGSNAFSNSANRNFNYVFRTYNSDINTSFQKKIHAEDGDQYPVISFDIPKDIKKVSLNKIKDWWIRVRILRGGTFSREIQFDDYGRITQTALVKPPFFRSFTLNFSASTINAYPGAPEVPCTTIIKENALSLEEVRSPIDLVSDTPKPLYPHFSTPVINRISESELENSERALFWGLKNDTPRGEQQSLFFSITPELSMSIPNEHLALVDNSGLLRTIHADRSNSLIPTIIWQYWSGSRWKSLDVTDRTEGLTTAQSIQFTVPADIQERTLFENNLLWVRGYIPQKRTVLPLRDGEGNLLTNCLVARGDKTELAFDLYDNHGSMVSHTPNGHGDYIISPTKQYFLDSALTKEVFPYYIGDGLLRIPPHKSEATTTINSQIQIQGINQNMVLAESLETVYNETLGNSSGGPNQQFSFVSKPISVNPIILIRENNSVDNNEHMLVKRNSLSSPTFIQEADKEKRLHLINEENFEDTVQLIEHDTERHLWVEWQEVETLLDSGPNDRHYVVDHTNGTISFGDNINGRIPDKGLRNVLAKQYRFGGGAGSNIKIGEIRNIVSSIPYISSVNNLTIAKGGDDLEDSSEIFNRATREIAAFGRAVTAEDYEALALTASGGIHRVKAYAGLRPDGTYQTGWVTLVLIADQLGARPVPSGEFMATIESYLTDRCSTNNVNAEARFNPIGTQQNERTSLKNISVVPPNYITTWVESSISFDNEVNERTLTPLISRKLSQFLHARTGGQSGTGWDFGRDVYLSEMSRVISEIKGVKEVREIRLKANQMRFVFTLASALTLDEDQIRGVCAIPSGALVTSQFPKTKLDGSTVDFPFQFISSKPIAHNSKKVVVEGFKEGDILTLKTLCDIGYEDLHYTQRERVLGRARVTAVETHFFGGFVKNDSGETIRGISHFRIYLHPMSLKLAGRGKRTQADDEYIITNSLDNDTLITAEAQHGSFSLTGESKTIRTYVKQIISSDGTTYRRMGGEMTLQGIRGIRNDDMRHSPDMDVKKLSQLGDDEIVAIDVAIPNLWGTASDDINLSGYESSEISVYPLGKQEIVQTTLKGELQPQKALLLDPENIFFYEELEKNGGTIDNDHFMLIPEYTEQVFVGPTDLPTAGHHRIITDILLSEGEDAIAHTSVQNTTHIPDFESHIWYKTRTSNTSKDGTEMDVSKTLINDITAGAKKMIAKLQAGSPTDESNERIRLFEILIAAAKKQAPNISNTTDASSMSPGAFTPTDS